MSEINTLQERIQQRCLESARRESERLLSTLPYFGDLDVYSVELERSIKLRNDHICRAMRAAITTKLHVDYVNKECEELLRAVDQIEALTEEVDNIRRG